ncbi:hypothetical protein LTR85_011832 [Meristemomyces frigidus]|nr:hypothetical protein LTR85_011832 [Meristemomyces frigidus]
MQSYQKWAKEYGPVYSLILGNSVVIVLSSDEAVRDLLDKRSAIYSSRPDNYIGQTIISDNNRLIFMKHHDPQWKMIRRLGHNLLNIQKAESYVPYQDLESTQMLYEMVTEPERFLDSVRRFTASLTTSLTFGLRTVSFRDPRMTALFDGVQEITELSQNPAAMLLDVFPILRWLPDVLLSVRKRARALQPIDKELRMDHWLEAKHAVKAGTANPCFCVDMARVQEKEGLSDDLAAYTAGSMLEAGAETTSNTLYGFVQAMLLFPVVQHKIQTRIDEVVGDDRLPMMSDYAQLPYIRSCIKESLRWMPTAIMVFPHAVTEDDTYRGYHIPKGASVLPNGYTIQMDPERHLEPRQYNPDRYNDDDLSLADSAANPDASKRDHFNFGAGRRICQGMHVAERSLFLGIARLMWAFDITPAQDDEGRDVLPDPDRYTQGFICMPEPFRATIRPRSEKRARIIREVWEQEQKRCLDPETQQWKVAL